MKKVFLYIIFTSIIFTCFSQVGVNTKKPQGIFHIDANTDTDQSGQISDDIIVTAKEGNIGLGTLTPTNKLDVEGNIRLDKTTLIDQTLFTETLIVNDSLRIGTPNIFPVENNQLANYKNNLEIFANPITNKGLKFDDGSQNLNTEPTLRDMIPVMTTTNDGYATWTNLPATVIREIGAIKDGIIVNNNTETNITDKNLRLSPGVWLIYAGIATDTHKVLIGSKDGGMGVYLKLKKGASETVDVVAETTETNGYGVAMPSLVYPVVIPPNVTYEDFYLTATTSITVNSYGVNSTYGEPYFFAIKIDKDN